MLILIPLKPLSVNNAWRGRKFKTKDYIQYEEDCFKLIKGQKTMGLIEINYKFYYKTRMLDIDNPIKPLQDILGKCGLFEDDSRIMKITVEKFKSEADRIEIIIEPYKIKE